MKRCLNCGGKTLSEYAPDAYRCGNCTWWVEKNSSKGHFVEIKESGEWLYVSDEWLLAGEKEINHEKDLTQELSS